MENVLSILFCLTLLYLVVTSRIKTYVSILRMQGVLLSVIMVFPFIQHLSVHILIIPIMSFVVKAIIIPRFIDKIVIDLDVKRIVEPSIQPFNFLLLTVTSMSIIFVAAHVLSGFTPIEPIPFASAFSAMITGIYLIIFRKKLIVHVVGFLILENGIFLFGTSVAAEMPTLVELGAMLDVFVVVFLMGIAINKISSTFAKQDVSVLGRLKD
jgi:hydrogenase-4 component E